MHVALDYAQDLKNYSTLRNIAVMIGKQKHKVFKIHAPNTNSQDTEQEHLKAINLSQTIRFMLDRTHLKHSQAEQINRIVSQCEVLRTRFLGATEFTNVRTGNVCADGTGYVQLHVGLPIPRSRIPARVVQSDTIAVIAVWEQSYDT